MSQLIFLDIPSPWRCEVRDRAGNLVATVDGLYRKDTFIKARVACIAAYKRAGIVPHAFDCDPPFEIVTVGRAWAEVE